MAIVFSPVEPRQWRRSLLLRTVIFTRTKASSRSSIQLPSEDRIYWQSLPTTNALPLRGCRILCFGSFSFKIMGNNAGNTQDILSSMSWSLTSLWDSGLWGLRRVKGLAVPKHIKTGNLFLQKLEWERLFRLWSTRHYLGLAMPFRWDTVHVDRDTFGTNISSHFRRWVLENGIQESVWMIEAATRKCCIGWGYSTWSCYRW